MKTFYQFNSKEIAYSLMGIVAILTTSCGSYQNSSYYDNDGVYGSERPVNQTENKYTEQNIEKSNKYAQQFKNMQDDYTYFTDVDNYNSQTQDTIVTVYRNESNNNYAGWGNNSSDVTINYYNNTNIGDTFVGEFKFTKLVKTETEIYKEESQQITEIVNVILETTVDVKNRNDLSITKWNNRFQPRYEEYQKYNKVYSQQSNLLLSKDTDYRFKKVNEFSNNIISTKVKVPGEVIDSWTDLQLNNVMSLDGKHGPINSLHKFKDELYAFQARDNLLNVMIPSNRFLNSGAKN